MTSAFWHFSTMANCCQMKDLSVGVTQTHTFYEIHLPVVEGQRFLFVCGIYFVLKEEDLNQNYLQNHQANHNAYGQTKRDTDKKVTVSQSAH